jgi:glutamine amidotransferase
VRRLPAPRPGDPLAVRIPNVGWRGMQRRQDDPLLRALGSKPMAYFVHSYGFYPTDGADAVAVVRVNGETPAAIVRRGNIVGCQFHPEKSGPAGLDLLNAFLAGVRASPEAMRSADANR